MSTVAYLRVSKLDQDLENQKLGIKEYCKNNKIKIDRYIEEKISSRKKLERRQIMSTIENLHPGDVLILSEVSRAGRDMMDLFEFMKHCFTKNVEAYFVKQQLWVKNDPQTKFMVSALAFAAEMERSMMSARIKESLALRKSRGFKLGLKKGTILGSILDKKEGEIVDMVNNNNPVSDIAEKFECSKMTVYRFLDNKNIRYGTKS